jgi:hypothetical protein
VERRLRQVRRLDFSSPEGSSSSSLQQPRWWERRFGVDGERSAVVAGAIATVGSSSTRHGTKVSTATRNLRRKQAEPQQAWTPGWSWRIKFYNLFLFRYTTSLVTSIAIIRYPLQVHVGHRIDGYPLSNGAAPIRGPALAKKGASVSVHCSVLTKKELRSKKKRDLLAPLGHGGGGGGREIRVI